MKLIASKLDGYCGKFVVIDGDVCKIRYVLGDEITYLSSSGSSIGRAFTAKIVDIDSEVDVYTSWFHVMGSISDASSLIVIDKRVEEYED